MVESAVSKTVQGGFDSRLEHMKLVKPKFKCQKCKKIFVNSAPGPTLCIFCGHNYVDWLNYDAVITSLPKDWRTKTFEEVWLNK